MLLLFTPAMAGEVFTEDDLPDTPEEAVTFTPPTAGELIDTESLIEDSTGINLTEDLSMSIDKFPTWACEFFNCMCRFILEDDISSTVFWETCGLCIEAPNPYICTACPSALVGIGIGCGSYCKFFDDYEKGRNWCRAESLIVNAIDLFNPLPVGAGDVTGYLLNPGYTEVDCNKEELTIGLFPDLCSNPQMSPYLNYFDPPKPVPGEDVISYFSVFNMGTRVIWFFNYRLDLYRKKGELYDYYAEPYGFSEGDDLLVESRYESYGGMLSPPIVDVKRSNYGVIKSNWGQLPVGHYYLVLTLDPYYRDPDGLDPRLDSSCDPAWGCDYEVNNYGTSYEDNNEFVMFFTVDELKKADLRVESIDILSEPTAYGTPANAVVTIRNVGHLNVDTYLNNEVKVAWYKNDNSLGSPDVFHSLAPGQEITFSRQVYFNESGDNEIKVLVDSYDHITPEEDEDNNVLTLPVKVYPVSPEALELNEEPLFESLSEAAIYWAKPENPSITSYTVYYSTDGSSFIKHGTTTINAYMLDSLASGNEYQVYVTANNTAGRESNRSNIITVSTSCPISIDADPVPNTISGITMFNLNVTDEYYLVDNVTARAGGTSLVSRRLGVDNVRGDGWTIYFDTRNITYAEDVKVIFNANSENCTTETSFVDLRINNNPVPSFRDAYGGEVSGVEDVCVTTYNVTPLNFVGLALALYDENQTMLPDVVNFEREDLINDTQFFMRNWCFTWNTTAYEDGDYALVAFLGLYNETGGGVSTYNKKIAVDYEVDNIPDMSIYLKEPPAGEELNKTINLTARVVNAEYEPFDCAEFYFVRGSQEHYIGSAVYNETMMIRDYDTRNICENCEGNFKIIARNNASWSSVQGVSGSVGGLGDPGIAQAGGELDTESMLGDRVCTGGVVKNYTRRVFNKINNSYELFDVELQKPVANEVVHGVFNITLEEEANFLNITSFRIFVQSATGLAFWPLDDPVKIGDSWTTEFDTTLEDDGRYSLLFVIDAEYKGEYEYVLLESGEFTINNDHWEPEPPEVDFTFYPERIDVSGPKFKDKTITLHAQIKNIGNESLPSSDGNRFMLQVRAYYKEPGGSWRVIRGGHFNLWSDRGNPTFDPGEVIVANQTFTPSQSGDYEFRFAVDTVMPDYSFNYHEEQSEDNNVFSQGVTIFEDDGVGPDSPMAYFFDRLWEAVQLAITFDPQARSDLELMFASERIVEAESMILKGRTDLVEGLLSQALNTTNRINTGLLDDRINTLLEAGAAAGLMDEPAAEEEGGVDEKSVCGNGECDEGENCFDCPGDCMIDGQICCGSIGINGDCCGINDCAEGQECYHHNCTNISCGDGRCQVGENCANCPADCLDELRICCWGIPYQGDCCNNSDCSPGFSCINHWCQHTAPTCGDGVCADSESPCTCSLDCGVCMEAEEEEEEEAPPSVVCGDGVCEGGETISDCCFDCKTSSQCCSNSDCEPGYTCTNNECVEMGPECGDGSCDEGEDCGNCPADCLDSGEVCCDAVAYEGDCCEDGDCPSNVCTDYVCEDECQDVNCEICKQCNSEINACENQTKTTFSTCQDCIDHYRDRLSCDCSTYGSDLDSCTESQRDCECNMTDICSNFCDFLDPDTTMDYLYSKCMNLGYILHDYECVIQ